MRLLAWLVRALIFFTLFAFAVNNQHDAAIRWFFGQEWRAPMVFIVLAAFALGCAFGVFAMVPSWWRHRRVARKHSGAAAASLDAPVSQFGLQNGNGNLSNVHNGSPHGTLGSSAASGPNGPDSALPHPPRDGL